ncbi:MAG: ABC transporter permease [Chloroflexota bacterium]
MSTAKGSVIAPADIDIPRRRPSKLGSCLRFIRYKPLGATGGLVVLVLVFTALAAPVMTPYDPYETDLDKMLTPPGQEFPMGTDRFGRDVLTRIIWGARVSLYIGVSAVAIGQGTGGFLGLVSGYFGGKVDAVLQRMMDALMAFPMLVLALATVAALGPSANNVIIAVSVVQMPRASRVIRSATLSVKQAQYVEAARAIGCSDARILLLHVLPQCIAPFIIIATVALGQAILVEASMSFLGLGTPPPLPSWGRMLSGSGRQLVEVAPWLAIFPGLAISLAVFGFNLLGDAMRDVLDPQAQRNLEGNDSGNRSSRIPDMGGRKWQPGRRPASETRNGTRTSFSGN